MLYLRIAATAYWVALTVLLLLPNPWALLGFRPSVMPHDGRGVHFVAFTLLGLSVFLAGLPMRGWIVAVLLAAYGVSIELLQLLIPSRIVDAVDLGENLLGLALGAALYSAGRWAIRRWRRNRRSRQSIQPARSVDPATMMAATADVAEQRAEDRN
jgi:hypothetical protein